MNGEIEDDFPDPRQIARWRTITPARKYRSAMGLIGFGRRFQSAGLRARHPD